MEMAFTFPWLCSPADSTATGAAYPLRGKSRVQRCWRDCRVRAVSPIVTSAILVKPSLGNQFYVTPSRRDHCQPV